MPPTILVSKKARWLVARDWIVTFLRAPWGTDKTLVYLYYDSGFALIDRRPNVSDTVVAYQPPALPANASSLADYACTLDLGNPDQGQQRFPGVPCSGKQV